MQEEGKPVYALAVFAKVLAFLLLHVSLPSVEDQLHLLMVMAFPNISGFLLLDNLPCHSKMFEDWIKKRDKDFKLNLLNANLIFKMCWTNKSTA